MVDVLQYTGIVQGEFEYRVRREKHLGTAITIQLQQRIAMGAADAARMAGAAVIGWHDQVVFADCRRDLAQGPRLHIGHIGQRHQPATSCRRLGHGLRKAAAAVKRHAKKVQREQRRRVRLY